MKVVLQEVVALTAMALAGVAIGAPRATLSIRYAGSTTQVPTPLGTYSFVTAGSGFSQNSNLVYYPPEMNSNLAFVHYYDVGLTFTPETFTNGLPNESFRSAKINIQLDSHLQFVTPQKVAGTTGQKYFFFSLTSDITQGSKVFETNWDGGVAGDVQGIELLQSDAQLSAGSQVGVGDPTGFGFTWNNGKTIPVPTFVGRFGVMLTSPVGMDESIQLLALNGGDFSYFCEQQSLQCCV